MHRESLEMCEIQRKVYQLQIKLEFLFSFSTNKPLNLNFFLIIMVCMIIITLSITFLLILTINVSIIRLNEDFNEKLPAHIKILNENSIVVNEYDTDDCLSIDRDHITLAMYDGFIINGTHKYYPQFRYKFLRNIAYYTCIMEATEPMVMCALISNVIRSMYHVVADSRSELYEHITINVDKVCLPFMRMLYYNLPSVFVDNFDKEKHCSEIRK